MEFKMGDRVKINKDHLRYKGMRCSMKNNPRPECSSCLYYYKNIDNSIFTIKIANRDEIELVEKYSCGSGRSLCAFSSQFDVFKKAYNWIRMKGN